MNLCTLVASQAGDADNAPASLAIDLEVQGQAVPQAIVVPALGLRSLLGLVLLLGMIGVLHARRAEGVSETAIDSVVTPDPLEHRRRLC